MLVEKNKVMNLTAITDLEEVVQKHFLDSISLIKVEKLNQDISIIDLGTSGDTIWTIPLVNTTIYGIN